MGRRVVELATERGFSVVTPVPRGAISTLKEGAFDVVIDFSSPVVIRELALVIGETRTPLVTGTTGLGPEEFRALERASQHAAVFAEPNMSLGVHVLAHLVKQAVASLGPDFDVEVAEIHHRLKADAPSGTAGRLVDAVKEARGESSAVFGRSGLLGRRPQAEIGVFALRGGDVVGDHSVYLLGAGERLELTHRATNRDVFVYGALRAAAFLVGKPPGRYGMADLVPEARS